MRHLAERCSRLQTQKGRPFEAAFFRYKVLSSYSLSTTIRLSRFANAQEV